MVNLDNFYIFPSGKKVCKLHNKINCKECNTPRFPMENVNNKKVKGKKFYKYQQVTHKYPQGVYERFHSFGVRFDAVVFWDALFKFPEVRLRNNVSYKRLDFDSAIVKVFRKSILVSLRASKDIKGLMVRDAELLAKRLVSEVLGLLPKAITVLNPEIVSVHNAFVNHPTARHNVKVVVDDDVRLISDNSKGCPEFEAVNPVFAVSDSEKLEFLNKDIITNPFDLPSVTKVKLDTILKVQEDYALNISKHLKVQDKTLDVLNAIHASLAGFDSPLFHARESPQGVVLETSTSVLLGETLSKYDIEHKSKRYRLFMARKYLKDFGWGDSVW